MDINALQGSKAEVCHLKSSYLEQLDWKKTEWIGAGAYSNCYKAIDIKSGRIMALKQVRFTDFF